MQMYNDVSYEMIMSQSNNIQNSNPQQQKLYPSPSYTDVRNTQQATKVSSSPQKVVQQQQPVNSTPLQQSQQQPQETKEQREYKVLQQKNATIEKQQQETVNKNCVLQADLKKAQEETTKTQKELDSNKELVKDLQNQIKAIQEKSSKEIASLNSQLDYFKVNDPNTLKAQAKAQIKELSTKHQKELKTQQEESEAQINQLNEEIQALQQDLKVRQHDFNDQEKLLKMILENQNKDLTGIQNELMYLKQQNEQLSSQLKTKQDKMNEMFKTIQNQESALVSRQSELKRLHNTLAQQQQINEQKFTDMQHMNETQQNTIMMFQKEITDMKANALIIEKQYQENERKLINDTQMIQRQYDRDQQKNTEEYIKNLNIHISQIEKQKQESTKLHNEYFAIIEENKKLQAENSEIIRVNLMLRENYQQQLNVQQNSFNEATKKLETELSTKKTIQTEHKELDDLQITRQGNIDNSSQLKIENLKQAKIIDQLKLTVKTLIQNRTENEETIRTLKQQDNKNIVKQQPVASNDGSTSNILINQINQLKIIIKQLEDTIAGLQQQIATQQEKIRKLSLNNEDPQMRKQLQQKEFAICQMKQQIKELESEMEYSHMTRILSRK
ncbi:Hypothetical_protein [Hexamita inflata]|uniref:Hypothetical_protein n=1 Tax=Hexamita inflata TaxID=28002 RepID=A0AA86V300_9EUKA|nr:Hypothetical protein HINF_LOCUS61892 [Hexamita inflata]